MLDRSHIEKAIAKIEALEHELANPATVADQKRYRTLLAEHQHLTGVRDGASLYLRLVRDYDDARQILDDDAADADMREMAEAEAARIEEELPEAERKAMIALLPPDPDDSRNTIMEIRAGTGGEEAALFAGDLYRMYTRYAETRGWKTEIIDASPASMGGMKEIVFSVEGDDVYRMLRYESGGHRVQRIPVTEAGGRIHTSAATVAVLPEVEDVDEVEVAPDDIRIDLYRASGPGGQKVNKTESAVRITHLATGLVAQSQDERSQQRNREKAMRVLKARLLEKIREEEEAKTASERRLQVGSGDRSERIRTYNFPQNRMTDHRINLTLYNLDRLIEGDLDELFEALQTHDIEDRLRRQLTS